MVEPMKSQGWCRYCGAFGGAEMVCAESECGNMHLAEQMGLDADSFQRINLDQFDFALLPGSSDASFTISFPSDKHIIAVSHPDLTISFGDPPGNSIIAITDA